MEDMNVIEKIGLIEDMVYKQTKMIDLLCSIIDEQFQLLLQYMTVEELDRYPLLNSMKSIADLKESVVE